VREAWERRNPDLPLKSPDQLVILASIIEKETGKPEERTRIAAVFANRLKQKMKLQTDPTVIYGLVYGKGALGHPLTRSELAQSTPYNTYIIDGLPPGPICNPGRASIEAAANPARTKELYFAADGTGGHAFADTYDQHLKNVARLRVIEHGGDPAAAAAAPDAQAPAAPARPPAAQRGQRSASGSGQSAAQKPAGGLVRSLPPGGLVDAAPPPLRSRPDSDTSGSFCRVRPMALSSMTGFARGHGVSGAYSWSWELKSVNAKGLDLRLRLPPGWDAVEGLARASAAQVLARGTVYGTLAVERKGIAPVVRINEPVLNAVLATIKGLAGRVVAAEPRLDGILSLKGVIDVVDEDEREAERGAAEAVVIAGFGATLAELATMRRHEGEALGRVLTQRAKE